jgi:hypothetical protein
MVQDVDVREQLLRSLTEICDPERSFTDQDKLFCFKVPGEHAEGVWMLLREQADASGMWPVILGTDDDCEEQIYAATHPDELGFEAAELLIQKGLKLDVKQWLTERYNEEPDFYQTDEEQPDTDKSPVNAIAQKYQFYSVTDLQKEYHPEINLALIPTRNHWEVPAHLYYGGWNECPNPDEHVGLFKYWFDKYGAEVFAMAGDVVELYVRKPPKTKPEALDLAREHFVYCSDIVHQGTKTVHALADEIVDSNGWFFWWD